MGYLSSQRTSQIHQSRGMPMCLQPEHGSRGELVMCSSTRALLLHFNNMNGIPAPFDFLASISCLLDQYDSYIQRKSNSASLSSCNFYKRDIKNATNLQSHALDPTYRQRTHHLQNTFPCTGQMQHWPPVPACVFVLKAWLHLPVVDHMCCSKATCDTSRLDINTWAT